MIHPQELSKVANEGGNEITNDVALEETASKKDLKEFKKSTGLSAYLNVTIKYLVQLKKSGNNLSMGVKLRSLACLTPC